jgi:hypothetical protein
MKTEISQNQRDFLKIVRWATSVAFGAAGGVLAGLRNSGSGFVLQFNFWVIPAVLGGAAVGWAYWQFVATRVVERESRQNTRRFGIYTVLLAMAGLLCFLYPIRYVVRSSVSDVVQGVVMAFLVVGVVGWLLWSVARLLNAPPPPPADEQEED